MVPNIVNTKRIMCPPVAISRSMVRMSKRTYSHRLEVATPNIYSVGQLARLNRDLDGLFELIYSQWRTVTEDDYKVFGGQYRILLETIKSLYDTCRKAPREMGLKEESQKLGMNYSALYELNTDIVNFAIKAPKDKELKDALKRAGELMNW